MAPSDEAAFAECKSAREVFSLFRSRCAGLGVRLLSVLAPLPFHSVTASDTYVQFWGYDPHWQTEYLADGWDESGRIEDQILEYGAPILWADIEEKIDLGAANRRILAHFFDYHGRDGICMPLFGHFAFQTLLSFAFTDRIASVDDPRVATIAQLAMHAQRRYIDLSRSEQQPKSPLSSREQEVLQQMACGRTKKAVARELGISLSSIDTYQRRIYMKLEVNDRTEAVVRSLAMGLVKL